MKIQFSFVFCLAAFPVCATGPHVAPGSVVLTQDRARLVTVAYELTGAPGIVTFDIQTNRTGAATADEADWVSIGESFLTNATGDVNKFIGETGAHAITWNPRETWPDHRVRNGGARAVVTAWSTNAPPLYMSASLVRDKEVRFYASAAAVPGGVQDRVYKTEALLMRRIDAQLVDFQVGSAKNEFTRYADELQHDAVLTNANYYMAVYPLTLGQLKCFGRYSSGAGWAKVTLTTGTDCFIYGDYSKAEDGDTNACPVTISYGIFRGSYYLSGNRHAVDPSRLVGLVRAKTGVDFDLPTEAQWEFAARAGTKGQIYDDVVETTSTDRWHNNLKKRAWYTGSAAKGYHVVGSKLENPWGLYDMLGNINELCLDRYAEDYGGTEDPYEPEGAASGSAVAKGGSYLNDYPQVRISARIRNGMSSYTYTGGRLMCPVSLVYPAEQK